MTLDLEKRLGQCATVGVGIPGAISPATGLVKNANSTWCNGKAFDADLGRALNREVRMNNDANCLAVSEATDGAAAGAHLVFAIILGTGVGGGIAIDGKPHVGRLAIGGEWGHNPLPWPREDELPGPQCFCGRRGCIERYCSGPGFAEDFLRVTGRELSSADIISGMRNGDAECSKAFERYVDRLARGLSHVINIIDPDAVVLGGGMSNVDSCTTQYRLSLNNTFCPTYVIRPCAKPNMATRVVFAVPHGCGETIEELGAVRRTA